MEQISLSGKGALATPRYGRSNLGTRIDNGGTVPQLFDSGIILRTKFFLWGGEGGGGCNTPNYTLIVYYMFRV